VPRLHPFRAFTFHSGTTALKDLIYIPGEDKAPRVRTDLLWQDAEPALYVYRQSFRFPGDKADSERLGVMGLLDRSAAGAIYPHEEVRRDRVLACERELQAGNTDPGSMWFWINDHAAPALETLLRTERPADIATEDRLGTRHEIWRVTDTAAIGKIQQALEGKELFLTDGHHRFAAGWNLATIQIRTPALRTRPVHWLIIDDLPSFQAGAGADRVPLGLMLPGKELREVEIGSAELARILSRVRTESVRSVEEARRAVDSGRAKIAIVRPEPSVDDIEAAARKGIVLPPKSTDFYPKLAAGLVMYRHQKEAVTPPVPQRPGVL